jgi:DNA polymerase I-like protein with 3'-5' exonuclease and polymerase domains
MNFVGFDIETNATSPWEGEILSVALEPHVWLTTHHPDHGGHDYPPDNILLERDWEGVVICGHNLFFDLQWWLHKEGYIWSRPMFWDTMVAQSILDENTHPNSLDNLCDMYLGGGGYEPDAKKKRMNLVDEPGEYVREYNLLDAKNSSKIAWLQHQKMDADQLLLMGKLMKTLTTLVRMTVRGVTIDTEMCAERLKEMHARKEELEGILSTELMHLEEHDCAYEGDVPDGDYLFPAMLSSPQQLVEALFTHMQLPVLERSKKTREPSTSGSAIQKALAFLPVDDERREVLARFIEWREVSKLAGTYLGPFLDTHVRSDGAIHGRYSLAKGPFGGTVTGRLSSREPNLQNVPRDGRVKDLFVPRAGLRLFEADYAQLEMRVAGYYSQDPKLLDIFKTGRDIHTGVLADLWEEDYEELAETLAAGDPSWKERRAAVKQVNFSILYGAAAPKVRELLSLLGVEMGEREVQEIMNRWRDTYAEFTKWESGVKSLVEEERELWTPLGRCRHLQGMGLQRAFRQGVNFLIQSFASDFMTLSLPIIDEELTRYPGDLLLTVHDSVIGEYEHDAFDVEGLVRECMVDKLLEELREDFGVDTTGLYLEVDVEDNKENWYG